MIMPDSAMVPSIATKPNGMPNASRATVTPIRPSGAVITTMSTRWKLCSCSISTVSTTSTNSGRPATIDFPPLALSSTAPPVSTKIAGRQRGAELREARLELRRDRGRLDAAVDVGAHGDGGQAVAAPDRCPSSSS